MQLTDLPAVNAILNACAFCLLIWARMAIRRGDEARHRALMLTATSVSVLFLISYLTYHAQHGSTRFTGEGAVRGVYFGVLISHTILAAVLVPLVVATLAAALRGRRERHRKLARFTWPVWAYVSATGVLIYLMLYQL